MIWIHIVCIILFACAPVPEPGDAGPFHDAVVAHDVTFTDTPDAGAAETSDANIHSDAGPLPASRRASAPFTEWVDPKVGTGGIGFGVGSASIAPQRPFGMIRPGPDTGNASGNGPLFYHCSGYYAGDSHIWGFSQMRMHGTGIVDYGHIALMPTDGLRVEQTTNQGYASPFDKSTEEAAPGYYRVELGSEEVEVANIGVEITASERVARYRFDFEEEAESTVLVDASHILFSEEFIDGAVFIDAEAREVSGFSHIAGGYSGRFGGARVYFVARFDQDPSAFGTFRAGEIADGSAEHLGEGGAFLRFAENVVEVAIAVSFVDVEHARMNLNEELAPFEEMREATRSAWESVLSRVEISGRSDEDFRRFYTALYQSMLMPTLAVDVDGSYRGVDNEVHQAEFRYSTDFSLWDTFRTQVPLLGLLYPDYLEEQLRSLLRMAADGGIMPRWPLGHGYTGGMVGESAAVAFSDALIRGIPFDLPAAYAALRRTAFENVESGPYRGRRDLEGYIDRGFVASDAASWSVSATLEFAYNDSSLAMLAGAAGAEDDALLFGERSGTWQNVWDDARGFFVGRDAEGVFDEEFRENTWRDYYAEGNARQYLWYVPHDLEGLAARLGGRAALLGRLGSFFESSLGYIDRAIPSPYYWQGNEPDIHAPWLFSAYGDVDGAARWTRWVADTFFGLGSSGLPGNDDSGTMSAWYVFAALGIYPIAGTETWLYSAPLLTEAILHRSAGDVVLSAPRTSRRAPHVEEVTISTDTERALSGRFDHADIAGGAELHFEMSEP